MCGKLRRRKEATMARVQGSMENVASDGLALEQRKGCGVVVKSLDFIFSATDLVYSVILLTPAWRGDCRGEAGRQGEREREQKRVQENSNFCVAVLQVSALLTKKYFILPSFLKISFVYCHWRTMLLIYLKYLC